MHSEFLVLFLYMYALICFLSFLFLTYLAKPSFVLPKNFVHTVYPKKYAHGFCFAVLCCGYTLTDFPICIRLTSLALWQSNDCPSASKATLMNMDKYFMWIHYERLHNHNKAKHNKTVCIFLGIYCTLYIHTYDHITINHLLFRVCLLYTYQWIYIMPKTSHISIIIDCTATRA